VLGLSTGQIYPHESVWIKPFVKNTVDNFRQLCADIHDAHVKHVTRKHMKLDEDPWENYLYYDSKHLLPLICHNAPMPIEKQIIIARFIDHAMQEETIS